jgi:hypothetical protein
VREYVSYGDMQHTIESAAPPRERTPKRLQVTVSAYGETATEIGMEAIKKAAMYFELPLADADRRLAMFPYTAVSSSSARGSYCSDVTLELLPEEEKGQ